ncbi:aminotransferase class V-fold PLP-dependent enzyme [Kineococcus sp. NUM-3379]
MAAAQQEFAPATTYLDTAAVGLPPARALAALRAAQDDWAAGRLDARGLDAPVEGSRAAYAALVGVPVEQVAVGSQVSVFAGAVAASVPDGGLVVVPAGEFTSVVFPFLAQAHRGVRVREVPLELVPEAVADGADLVALSAVQSADGRLADLDAVEAAAAVRSTPVLLDTTQAAGWLPVDAGRFAFTVGGGYKWLLAARGTCFATVRPDVLGRLVPTAAGWYAGQDRWSSIYGGPLRLAGTARRHDVSPAWFSWVSQQPALELLLEVGAESLHRHAVALAERFRAAVGLPTGDSAIVSVRVRPGGLEELQRAGVVASTRAGRLRLAFHLHNTPADADLAATCLRGHVEAAC